MALTAAVVERTPYRLLYLITADTQQGTTLTIPNVNGVTPDLGTDSLDDTPLGDVMDRDREFNDVNSIARARALLLGDGAPGGPDGDFNAPRCHCHITARTISDGWGVDANVDGTGNPQIVLFGPNVAATAYLEILYSYSAAT